MRTILDSDLCHFRTAIIRLKFDYLVESIIGQIGHCIGGNFNIHIWAL